MFFKTVNVVATPAPTCSRFVLQITPVQQILLCEHIALKELILIFSTAPMFKPINPKLLCDSYCFLFSLCTLPRVRVFAFVRVREIEAQHVGVSYHTGSKAQLGGTTSWLCAKPMANMSASDGLFFFNFLWCWHVGLELFFIQESEDVALSFHKLFLWVFLFLTRWTTDIYFLNLKIRLWV